MTKIKKQDYTSVVLKLPSELHTLVKLATLTEKNSSGRNKTVVDVVLERLEIGMKAKMPLIPQTLIDSQK